MENAAGHVRSQGHRVGVSDVDFLRDLDRVIDLGALDANINAALSYSEPYDPISGSSDIRGQLCRVELIRP